ncbi:iron uptake porin [Pseudanabaena sp. ABRG5-3]|uniref:iron uptake porin n=1 Tax=Pseudanabaena sp. ABRG5-3 TaxID=685565 RepID=UPI000DC6EA70|nr:iron uptake porin [Pseudanabaena sp. ABRG5-3]BBC24341.1 S-layer region-like protein [Pseudanabaena sp. ABRG5-3]
MKIDTKLGLLLLSLPLSLGAISLSAEAKPANPSTTPSTVAFTETTTASVAPISSESSESPLKAIANDPIAQNVTSVSQLSDVRPTDWAFTALQSLVERYGCIAGYPDRTFRGKQATSRYEFAAGLNACLDKINEIISAGLADKVSKEDLATLQKLQEEFAAELATLRGRVDALDAKTAKLEAQQFSTTTKLSGEAIFSVSGATGANPTGGTNTNIVFNNRVRLNLLTSFSGKDLLITGLQATNINSLAAPLGYADTTLNSSSNVRLGFENQFLNFNPSNSNTSASNSVNLYKLLYIFPVADKLTMFAGSNAEVSDAFPAISPFASESQGSISRFGQGLNAATRVSGGTSGTGLAAAVGFIWTPSDQVDFRALYGSVNSAIAANSPTTLLGAGFFGGSTIAAAQLTLKPTSNLDIGLNYANSYHQINILGTGLASADINAINVGAGNNINDPIKLNSIGSTLTWRITPKIAFNLSGAWIFANLTNKDASTTFTSWMTGFHFSDVFNEGNTAGLLFGQPLVRNAVGGLATIPTGFTATPYQLEGYFNFKVSKNISVTPGVFFVFNPEGINNAPTATVGVVRTTFTF